MKECEQGIVARDRLHHSCCDEVERMESYAKDRDNDAKGMTRLCEQYRKELDTANLQIAAIQKAWNAALADGVDITPRSFEPLNHAILGVAVKP